MCQPYKSQMEEMYKKFYSTEDSGFNYCSCYPSCKSSVNAVETQYTIACSWSAKIGSKYGVYAVLPKVFIIGKEDVNYHSEIESPSSFQKTKNPHYRGTHDILAALLGVTDIVEKNGKKYTVQIGNTAEELHKLYSLSNQYHCAFKNNESRQNILTDNTMWDNCAELIKSEINILKPDIIVIQSGWATKKNAEKYIQRYFSNGTVEIDKQTPRLFWVLDNHGKRECCIIGAYHPRYPRWLSGKNGDYLNECVRQAREWFSISNAEYKD